MATSRFCGLCGQPLTASDSGATHVVCPSSAGMRGPAPTQERPPIPAPSSPSSPPATNPPGPPPAPLSPPVASRGSSTLVVSGLSGLSGRPREFHSVRSWIGGAYVRHAPAVGMGIAAAWFNAPVVILMGTIGAIVGGIAGLFSGTAFGEGVVDRLSLWTDWILPLPVGVGELVPTAAWQIGGIIGAAWGALNGALQLGWIAFAWPWQALYQGDPAWPVMLLVGQVLTALFVGAVYTAWSIWWEPWRLRRAGARRMSRREEEWLRPIIDEAAARMNLQGLPRIMITDSREVNAYAMTRHIVIHRGLLEHLNYERETVSAVLAHELAHWRYGDTVGATVVKGTALPLYLGYALALRIEKVPFRPLAWLLAPLTWGVKVCVRYLVAPVSAWIARRDEYRADRVALAAGYGPGLRRVLTQLSEGFDGSLDGWDEVVLRSHPYTELRLERLELAGDEYSLPGTTSTGGGPSSGSSTQEGW